MTSLCAGILVGDKSNAQVPQGTTTQGLHTSAHKATYQALSSYAKNLTKLARQGRLDAATADDDRQVRRIIDVLSREARNNPILTGGEHVDRNALVQTLAHSIGAGIA